MTEEEEEGVRLTAAGRRNGSKSKNEAGSRKGESRRPCSRQSKGKSSRKRSGISPCSEASSSPSRSSSTSISYKGRRPTDGARSPLLRSQGRSCGGDSIGVPGKRKKDSTGETFRDNYRSLASVGHPRGQENPLDFVQSYRSHGLGERRPDLRDEVKNGLTGRVVKRGMGHESSSSSPRGRSRGRERRVEKEVGRLREGKRRKGSRDKGEKRSEEREEEKEGEKKEAKFFRREKEKEEEKRQGREGSGREPCQRERIRKEKEEGIKRGFEQQLRSRPTDSRGDVSWVSHGLVRPSAKEDTQEGAEVPQEQGGLNFGLGHFGGRRGRIPEDGADSVIWGRAQDQRAVRAIPGAIGFRSPEGDIQNGVLGYGRLIRAKPTMAASCSEVPQTGLVEAHQWSLEQGATDPCVSGGQHPRREIDPSFRHLLAADERLRAASCRNWLPNFTEARSHPLREWPTAITAGTGLGAEGTGAGDESFRGPELQPWAARKRQEQESAGREDALQRKRREEQDEGQKGWERPGWPKERIEEEKREKDAEAGERPLKIMSKGPSDTMGQGTRPSFTGVEPPESGYKVAWTMREFFPRYSGPLKDSICLVRHFDDEGRERPSAATNRVCPSGFFDSPVLSLPSESREKEPPFGVRLEHLGEFVKSRFLGVLLHSQLTGRGSPNTVFPLPTSRDHVSRFFCSARDHEIEWVLAICIGLNSFWGGPLFNEKELSKVHCRLLEGFMNDVHRLSDLKETVDSFDWKTFFSSRSIDYKGEEVKTAKSFSWSNIGPALPKEIGVVPLRDLCEQGCKYYVDNFPQFLRPVEEWPLVKKGRVMVSQEDWPEVARNLVSAGVCKVIPESEVFKVRGEPLLNGLFGVEKGEESGGIPTYRLIMNLVPLNGLCQGLSADISGLPHWLGMHPFSLEPSEGLLVSSEDVRCFFYTLALPECWLPFLAFNRELPADMKPSGCQEPCYLSSRVLPMGFINSVGVAQHVHRVLVLRSKLPGSMDLTSREIRKDLPLPEAKRPWRVYLDNYDLLEKFPREILTEHQGTIAEEVSGLRQSYLDVGMPRHTGKSVSRQPLAEVQGALVDGVRGLAFPKGSKLIKYTVMGLKFCELDRCSQRQAQVICGGLVYFSTFRRQLLGSLNACWAFIESFNKAGRHRLLIPTNVKLEILRVLTLIPLCRMDFRLGMNPNVTCSDASTSGGGICCSTGLSPAGHMVAGGSLRPEGNPLDGRPRVLSIGLFDGIGCLRVALDLISANVIGHISVEKQDEGHRVVEYHFPGTMFYSDVEAITEEDIIGWSLKFGQVELVILGAGPPCQGVSGLNASRRGALADERSCLFIHVARIRGLLSKHFPWCPVHGLMESVASMDSADKAIMSNSFGDTPWEINSEFMTWCRRPRLYWITWDVQPGPGVTVDQDMITLEADVELNEFITKGWEKVEPDRAFPTFTTARPRAKPGHKPAGLHACDAETLSRWEEDCFRYPPYQYLPANCLQNRHKVLRLPNISEKELIMGLPLDYTNPCSTKSQRKTSHHLDKRHTLVGNAWCVPVVGWLLSQLLGPLGLAESLSPQQLMDRLDPSKVLDVRSKLLRQVLQPVVPTMKVPEGSSKLEQLLSRLVSAKGEDIPLSSSTDQVNSFQRLRQTVPARLWKWKIISGWKWRHGKEHINVLELRALETSIRWRIERLNNVYCRFVHLTDSLVCLHTVSRGRSSSRKLRRVMCRLNALLLASGVSPVWGYVHTDQNPADKPSRWAVRTKFRNAKGCH